MLYVFVKVGGEWSSTGGKAGCSTRPLTGSFCFCNLQFSSSQLKDLHSIPKPLMADSKVIYSINIIISQLNDVQIKRFLLEILPGILSTKNYIIFMTILCF
jgi:hypothetical protein